MACGPSAQAGRYDYKAGEGSAGLAVYDDVFAYSYHATDPANGILLNAFDLVRMHRFPDNDPKKSYQKMSAFALADEKVKLLVLAEKQKEADTDYKGNGSDDWKKLLQYDNKKRMRDMSDSKKQKDARVPLWEKYLLTVNEASEVFNIGEKKLRNLISNYKDADWIRFNGERLMIHRKNFERYFDLTQTF